jgi:hypothetical protein
MEFLKMAKKEDYGTWKPQMTMIVIAGSGKGKHAISKDAIEVIAVELCNLIYELSAHRSAVHLSAKRKMHMHLSGLVMVQPDYMEGAKQDTMFALWQSMSLKEQMMYLLGSLKNDMPMGEIMPDFDQEADMSWKKSQEPVVGLKYGKGYKLRCCPESLMAA